jgi:hypothetical protein
MIRKQKNLGGSPDGLDQTAWSTAVMRRLNAFIRILRQGMI